MKRNHEFLVQLGLKAPDDPIAPNHAPAKKRRKATPKAAAKAAPELPRTLRRSSRLAGKPAEHDGAVVDDLSDDEDLERTSRARVRDEMRHTAMEYLKAVREAACAVSASTPDEWEAEAKRRWGALAGGGADRRDWKLFVESRLSTPPPVSPLDFLQEYYAADVWRLLVSCVLMSRVSSWKTKHECISAFFARYPTPSALATESDHARIQATINSLGLFHDRLRSLVALTDHFLQGALDGDARLDTFDVSTDRASPHKIHGVGDFGRDSYLVFCKDLDVALSPGGKPIRTFLEWRKSSRAVGLAS